MENNKDLGFLTIGDIYLRTVKNIISELIGGGNPHLLFGEDVKNYNNITKRSDFNVSIPTLFLFFHGLEIIMKGLLIKLEQKINKDHKLTNNIKNLKKILDGKNSLLIDTIEKYIYKENMNTILQDLLKENNQNNTDYFYIFLKYPFDKREEKIYSHIPIKYKEEEFLPFGKEILDDINIIMEESLKIYRGII